MLLKVKKLVSFTVQAMVPTQIKNDSDQYYILGCAEWMHTLERNSIPNNPIFQAEWDKPLYLRRHKELLRTAPSDIERSRIQSISLDHATDWLYAIPVSSLGLKLSNSHLRTVCALRSRWETATLPSWKQLK